MKKTEYKMKVRDAYCYGSPVYRRVWVDENGEYFVKFDGELSNVSFDKNTFIREA